MAKKKRAAWGSSGVKMITLKYMINGSRFKMIYVPEQHEAARARVEALREAGVRVKVRNWPKRLVQPVRPLEAT